MATTEKFLKSIESSLVELKETLQKEKENLLEEESETFQRLLTEAIIRKLGYDEAVYNYYTREGEVIKQAIQTLNDKAKYKEILGF
jgi:carboxyl-terminal processing protease